MHAWNIQLAPKFNFHMAPLFSNKLLQTIIILFLSKIFTILRGEVWQLVLETKMTKQHVYLITLLGYQIPFRFFLSRPPCAEMQLKGQKSYSKREHFIWRERGMGGWLKFEGKGGDNPPLLCIQSCIKYLILVRFLARGNWTFQSLLIAIILAGI